MRVLRVAPSRSFRDHYHARERACCFDEKPHEWVWNVGILVEITGERSAPPDFPVIYMPFWASLIKSNHTNARSPPKIGGGAERRGHSRQARSSSETFKAGFGLQLTLPAQHESSAQFSYEISAQFSYFRRTFSTVRHLSTPNLLEGEVAELAEGTFPADGEPLLILTHLHTHTSSTGGSYVSSGFGWRGRHCIRSCSLLRSDRRGESCRSHGHSGDCGKGSC